MTLLFSKAYTDEPLRKLSEKTLRSFIVDLKQQSPPLSARELAIGDTRSEFIKNRVCPQSGWQVVDPSGVFDQEAAPLIDPFPEHDPSFCISADTMRLWLDLVTRERLPR